MSTQKASQLSQQQSKNFLSGAIGKKRELSRNTSNRSTSTSFRIMNVGDGVVNEEDKQRQKKHGLTTRNNVTLYNYGLKPMG